MEVPLGLVTDIGDEARDKVYKVKTGLHTGISWTGLLENSGVTEFLDEFLCSF